jgi:hypothetical protein
MRTTRQIIADHDVPRGDALPEVIWGPETVRRIEASCPGDTYMPPACAGDPAVVVEHWVAEAELTGTTDNYLGKRQHPRFTWGVIVLMRVLTGRLAGKVIRARTKNVSLGGLGVQVRSELESGTEIEIMVEGQPYGVAATVVHCTKAMTGNLVGLSFDHC